MSLYKKNKIRDNASDAFNSATEFLSLSPYTFKSASFTKGSLREKDCDTTKDDGKENAHIQQSSHDPTLCNRINALNEKYSNLADIKHHQVSTQGQTRYLSSELHLDENPLLRDCERK